MKVGGTYICPYCGDKYVDKGSHPATCGKRDCVIQGMREGLFKKPDNRVKTYILK